MEKIYEKIGILFVKNIFDNLGYLAKVVQVTPGTPPPPRSHFYLALLRGWKPPYYTPHMAWTGSAKVLRYIFEPAESKNDVNFYVKCVV